MNEFVISALRQWAIDLAAKRCRTDDSYRGKLLEIKEKDTAKELAVYITSNWNVGADDILFFCRILGANA